MIEEFDEIYPSWVQSKADRIKYHTLRIRKCAEADVFGKWIKELKERNDGGR